MNAAYKQLTIHLLRGVAALGFVLAGANHFVAPAFYQKMIPQAFPNPAALVAISGVFEVIGGLGLLVPALRRLAGWGLIALLIAVFPANLHMALHPDRFREIPFAGSAQRLHVSLEALLWIRLPFQAVFIAWVWFVGGANHDRVKTSPASG